MSENLVSIEAVQHRRNIRVKRKSFSLAFRKLTILASSDFRIINVSNFGGGKNVGISNDKNSGNGGGSGFQPFLGKSESGIGGAATGADIIATPGGRNNVSNSF